MAKFFQFYRVINRVFVKKIFLFIYMAFKFFYGVGYEVLVKEIYEL